MEQAFQTLRYETVMKCLPSHDWIYDHLGALPTKTWHLPSTSTRIKLWAAVAADLQFPLKGVPRIKSTYEALCALEKTGRTGLQIIRYFQGTTLWAQFLYLLTSRKALKSPSWCRLFLVTSRSFMRSEIFYKKCDWWRVLPLYQNHVYTILHTPPPHPPPTHPLLPNLFWAVSQSVCGALFWAAVLTLPPDT